MNKILFVVGLCVNLKMIRWQCYHIPLMLYLSLLIPVHKMPGLFMNKVMIIVKMNPIFSYCTLRGLNNEYQLESSRLRWFPVFLLALLCQHCCVGYNVRNSLKRVCLANAYGGGAEVYMPPLGQAYPGIHNVCLGGWAHFFWLAYLTTSWRLWWPGV